MAIPLGKVLSESEKGLLEVFYNSSYENSKIEKFSLTSEGKVNEFVLKKTWINEQPAHSLKGFKFQKLEKNSLDHYEVIEDELFLSLKALKEISLKISYPYNDKLQELALKVSPHLKVSGLRRLLQKKLKIEKFNILKNTSTLADENRLEECGVEENTRLMIEYKKNKAEGLEQINKGKKPLEVGPFPFADVKQTVTLSSEDFRIYSFIREFFRLNEISFVMMKLVCAILPIKMVKEPPPWKTLQGGLNFVGECQNIECEAYEQIVYSPKEYGTFHVGAEQCDACCPMPKCKKELINVNNCILLDCNYSIEGEYINKEKKPPQNGHAPKNRPFSFRENNIVEWNNLVIKTDKIRSYFSNCTIL